MLWTVEEDKEEEEEEKEEEIDDDDDDELAEELDNNNGDCGGGGKFKAKCRRGACSCHIHIVLPKSRAGLSDPAWRGLFEVGYLL